MSDTVRLRRLAAALTIWAILPIPEAGVMLPMFWLVPLAASIVVLSRGRRGGVVLPHWLQNVIGLGIAVLVAMVGGLNVGPLRPLGHLLLLLHTVCLLMVVDRKTFQRAVTLVGILWVVAVAGSSHVLLIPYLLLSVAIAWWTGMHVLLLDGDFPHSAGQHSGRGWRVPKLLHVAVATGLVVVLTVPLFLVMPRLRTAMVATEFGQGSVTGFSSVINLTGIGRITTSSRPVLVVYPGWDSSSVPEVLPELYFRGAVFDLTADSRTWVARDEPGAPLHERGGLLWLTGDHASSDGASPVRVEMLRPDRHAFLPPGTVALRVNTQVFRDSGGGIQALNRRAKLLGFEAWVVVGEDRQLPPPDERDLFVGNGNERVGELARGVTATVEGGAYAQAAAVAEHLRARCSYSLESDAPKGEDPLAWFLFDGQAGHCEFFAGSMVMLMRHLDVPARLVGGFVGGDYSSDLNGLVLRQSNAHTWVEVWIEREQRWARFDPTPTIGVPPSGNLSGWQRLRWAWDRLQAFWERRVITFGLGDQLQLAETLFGQQLRMAMLDAARRSVGPLLVLVVLATGVVWAWRRWRGFGEAVRQGPAALSLRRLERRLDRAGVKTAPAATPRAVGASAMLRWPGCDAALRCIVRLAELELYAQRQLDRQQRAELRTAWTHVRQQPL